MYSYQHDSKIVSSKIHLIIISTFVNIQNFTHKHLIISFRRLHLRNGYRRWKWIRVWFGLLGFMAYQPL